MPILGLGRKKSVEEAASTVPAASITPAWRRLAPVRKLEDHGDPVLASLLGVAAARDWPSLRAALAPYDGHDLSSLISDVCEKTEHIGEWVPRWGYKGANKDLEEQWIHELKNNGNTDMDPAKTAKKERLAKQAKNEKQRLGNLARAAASTAAASSSSLSAQKGGLGDANAAKLARAAAREKRKAELEADVLRSRASTASMGRFDKTLKGEQKQKGLKRKFDPNEKDTTAERASNLALLNKLGTSAMRKKAANTAGQGDADLVNTRKAVQFATGGHGVTSMKGGSGKRGRK